MKPERTEKRVLIGLIGMMLMLLPCLGHTAIPQTINYQGYLTNAVGVPIHGTLQIVFSIYDVLTGGVPLWTETQDNVSVTHGVYNVTLGSQTPIGLPFNSPYYLGVRVGTDPEMTPRKPLTAVPYAFTANYALSAQSRWVVGSVTGLPNLGADLPMPTLVGANGTNTVVIASGWADNGGGLGPITIQPQVTGPSSIRFTVHDRNGVPYDPASWTFVQIRYAVFLRD